MAFSVFFALWKPNEVTFNDFLIMSQLLLNRKEKAVLLVHGFVRSCIDSLPIELIELCLSMYFLVSDSWDDIKSSPIYTFSEDGIIEFKEKPVWRHPAFGKLAVAKGETMEWEFKITSTESNGYSWKAIMIGIIQSDKNSKEIDGLFTSTPTGMAYYCHGGEKYNKNGGVRYIQNAIKSRIKKDHKYVFMSLDMTEEKGTLSFKTSVDGKEYVDHGIAFDDIDADLDYSLAVALNTKQPGLQLLSPS